MAGEWRRSTIGELCDSGVAELQTGPFGTQLHAQDYVAHGVPVVPTEALKDRRIDHSVLPEVSPEKAGELARHRLRPGDILFARRGVQATGHIGYVREAEDGFLCGTGAIRLRVRKNDTPISPDFLSHVLTNPASVEWFKFHAIGATMPNLNEGIIRSFPLQVPTLHEQVAIAYILGTLDDKIELNRRMNENLEAIARALFRSWLVDFDPVRAKALGRPPSLPKPVADLFPNSFEDSEMGQIPKGWAIKQVGDLADVVGGATPSTQKPEFWESGNHAWATPRDLSRLSAPVLLDTERRITDAGVAHIGSGLLPRGTVLLSSRAPIGYLAVAEIPVAINQGFIAMMPKVGTPNVFLLFWARAAHDEIVSRANGSTFPEISKASFRPIPVVVPSERVMRAFETQAGHLYQRIVAGELDSRTLAALRGSLLPKLVSGELRVNDANRFIERAV